MALVPVVVDPVDDALVELEDVGTSYESLCRVLESQKSLFHGQIDKLQELVIAQCKLTGVNPLSQEMAAGALSIQVGKRPKDVLNPKAVKYMQSLFSLKDTIGKKETREISALCGITVTQVRDYFAAQRSRVKKLVNLTLEKATKSEEPRAILEGCCSSPDKSLFVKKEPSNDLKSVEECTRPPKSSGDTSVICSQVSLDTASTTMCAQFSANLGNSTVVDAQNVPSSGEMTVYCAQAPSDCGSIATVPTQPPTNSANSTAVNTHIIRNSGIVTPYFTMVPGNFGIMVPYYAPIQGYVTPYYTQVGHVNHCTQMSGHVTQSPADAAIVCAQPITTVSAIEEGQQIPKKTDNKSVGVHSSPPQEETTPGVDSDDKKFLDNIFKLMEKEETFSGQVKLMEWVLQIQNTAVLSWFSTKGGIAILARWLSEAASEEQTTVLLVLFKVLCHLPLHKALREQMSVILQTVNRLRFYRTSEISNRAKTLLSRWSRMFVKAMRNSSSRNLPKNAQDATAVDRIGGIDGDESWESKIDLPDDILAFAGSTHGIRKSEAKQSMKLLESSQDQARKNGRIVAAPKIKERRKVLMVENPDSKSGRGAVAVRAAPSNQSRPMSADDIQKAKMRAIYMQEKYGKSDKIAAENIPQKNREPEAASSSSEAASSSFHLDRSGVIGAAQPGATNDEKVELKAASSSFHIHPSAVIEAAQPETTNDIKVEMTAASSQASSSSLVNGVLPIKSPTKNMSYKVESPDVPNRNGTCQEQSLEKLKDQLHWKTPPEVSLHPSWRVAAGENSKEVQIQYQRNKREKETFYQNPGKIPPNPKEPWDIEMDYDDSLTPLIPMEQQPDDPPIEQQAVVPSPPAPPEASTSGSGAAPEPDIELLAVLLKNPEVVFALTSGEGKNLTNSEMVALLDTVKKTGVGLDGIVEGLARVSNGSPATRTLSVQVPVRANIMDHTSLPSPTPTTSNTVGQKPEFTARTQSPQLQSQHFISRDPNNYYNNQPQQSMYMPMPIPSRQQQQYSSVPTAMSSSPYAPSNQYHVNNTSIPLYASASSNSQSHLFQENSYQPQIPSWQSALPETRTSYTNGIANDRTYIANSSSYLSSSDMYTRRSEYSVSTQNYSVEQRRESDRSQGYVAGLHDQYVSRSDSGKRWRDQDEAQDDDWVYDRTRRRR